MPSFADEVIESHGVVLRPLRKDDVPAIAVACSDPQTQQWLPLPQPYTEDAARYFAMEIAPQELASGDALERAIEVEGQFAGVIGLKRTVWAAGKTEAGYWLGPWARGRGVTARALSAITDWALDSQGISRVGVLVATGNAASLATARKAGFIEEGTLRRAGYVHDGKVDLVVLSRLVDDPRPQFRHDKLPARLSIDDNAGRTHAEPPSDRLGRQMVRVDVGNKVSDIPLGEQLHEQTGGRTGMPLPLPRLPDDPGDLSRAPVAGNGGLDVADGLTFGLEEDHLVDPLLASVRRDTHRLHGVATLELGHRRGLTARELVQGPSAQDGSHRDGVINAESTEKEGLRHRRE